MKVGEEVVKDQKGESFREFLVTGSRDRSLIIWNLQPSNDAQDEWGAPRKILKGHSHFVSDIDLSNDSRFCLSSSWDGTIRLWNLLKGTTRYTMTDHKRDVLTVAFSPDNRQICSGSMDKAVKIWNIQGVCRYTIDQNPHTDWVSCVRYFHNQEKQLVVTASWDKTIKVWDNTAMSLMFTLVGHKGQVNTLDIAANTNIVASGGRDGKVNIWNVVEGRHLDEIDVESPVNVVLFALKQYWLVIGTEKGIRVYDLPKKKFVDRYEVTVPVAENFELKRSKKIKVPSAIGCTSLAWSKNQQYLYAGFTDGLVRVLGIVESYDQ
jgi:guanine nucleotide-binding protein subunit beta-2-like 1 protein